MTLLKPQDFTVKDLDGAERTYVLHRFDAWSGREICTQYPLTGMTSALKIGDYKSNEQLAQKLLSFVGVRINGTILPLTTRELVLNHVPDWETMGYIEVAMLNYNCSFFFKEKISTFYESFIRKIAVTIFKMWTDSSEQSSKPEKQPSTN